MKKLLSLIAVMLVAVTGMLGQSPAPGILNYQGVARNSVGNVLVNKSISLRLTIRDGSAAGPVVYQESRGVTTNPFGLFNVQLGSAGATSVTGTIAGVPWGVGLKYIQVEIDPNGGSAFINIGTAQLASVPYSLYSSQANDLVLPFNKTQSDAGTLFRVNNSGSGNGLMGTAVSGNGVVGSSSTGYGVTGTTGGANASGVLGDGTGAGVSSGVMGRSGEGSYPGIAFNAGVTGRANANAGVAGYALSGTGVFGSSGSGTGGRFLSTSGLSLHTSGGGVRLQNINEGVNRILATIPGDGTATWQDPSVIGIVTGSGTLNYVPKWTPNGTNLGNSQIFDNGTNIGIGTTTPTAKFSINELFKVTSTGTVQYANSVNPMMIMFESGTTNADRMVIAHSPAFPTWGIQYQDTPDKFNFLAGGTPVLTADLGTQNVGVGTSSPFGKLNVSSGPAFLAANLQGSSPAGTWLSLGNTDPGGRWFNLVSTATTNGEGPGKLVFFQGGAANLATGSIMTMVHSNMNVGINSNNPTAKLQVDQNSATDVGVLVNQGNAANVTNAVNVFKTNTTAGGFGNGAIYAQRGTAGGTYWTLAGATGITSLAATTGGTGIQGTSDSGPGLVGLSTNNIGVRGFNLNSGNAARFENAFNTANTAPVVLVNNISTQPGVYGVHSIISSTSPGGFSTALRGENNGTAGSGIGVWGSQNGSGWGVHGSAPGGLGVYGFTSSGIGVIGEADGGWGMRAISNTNTAIFSTSNSGFGGDFRSATNIAGLFQTYGAGNTVRGAIQTFNPSTNAGARAFYAQGSGFSGWGYNPGQVAEFQGNTTSGIVSISTNATSIVSASETGNAVYGQILTTNGNGNAAVLGASSNPNSHGLYGTAPNGGIGRALATSGPVQLTGINEATNRILASIDNFGNARWEDPSAIGVVSGSGTLNYVPKWTPNGTTLGNSQIFDNGAAVGIGTTTPTPAVKLDLVGTFTQFRLFDTDQNSQVWLSAPGLGYTGGVGTLTNHDFPIFTNGTDKVMVKNNGRVGIGTANPTAFTEILGNSAVGTPHLRLTENADDYGRLTLGNINPNNSGNNFWDVAGYTNDNRALERLNFYNNATGDLVSITGDGRMGVGTFNPFVKFHVNSGTDFNNSLLEAQTADNAGPHQYFYSGGEFGIVDYIRTNYTLDVNRRGALEVRGVSRLNLSPTNSVDMTTGMTIRSNGNVGIGTPNPIWKVDIAAPVAAMRLTDSDDGANIYLLAAGLGYTGGVGTNSNHDLPIFTNNIDRMTVKAATGDVGIATFTPAGRLHLISNPNTPGLISEANFTTAPDFDDMRYSNLFTSLNTNYGVVSKTGAPFNTNLPQGIFTGILGIDSSNTAIANGLTGWGVSNLGDGTNGVYGYGSKNASPTSSGYFGGYHGGTFWGGDIGMAAGVWSTVPDLESNGINVNKVGVRTFVQTVPHAGTNYGLFASGPVGGATNYAGAFSGDVLVMGNFSATGVKAFKIDHPLDPANKYLVHAAVESPEMMNIYNGNVVTDNNGRAFVELPAYFEAANKEFKYQLTIIDETQFAMARISKKISGNRFEIMTDKPGIEVSWQVTGVRNDVAADKYRLEPEEVKKANEKGKYLTPELYGMPADRGIHYMADPVVSKGGKAPLVPVTVSEPKEKKLPAPVLDKGAGTNKEAEEIKNTWAKPIEKPAADNANAEPGSTGNKVILTEGMLPKEPNKTVPATDPGKITPANTNAAANTGTPLMKPVMTGQLQRGTAPAAPVAEDANNKEREKLNKAQGEKPAPASAKPAEAQVKLEKGSVREGE